jgi:hypothetical protein
VAASTWSARELRRGAAEPDDPQATIALPYPAVHEVRELADGETVHLGPLALTAHVTPGHTPGGTTWTWETMLNNLWTQANADTGSALGVWPGLPFAPAGTPEGFWFPGVSAWDAICNTLDHLGLTVACDLTQPYPFTIVSMGADDPAFNALQAKWSTNIEDDLEWIDVGAARVPRVVKVLFRRRNSVYGTEETVRYDSFQWDMTAYHSVSVTAPALFANAMGMHYIWSDFTIRYDDSGNPSDPDLNTANAIAQERVSQYFDRIYSRTSGWMTQAYAGALPFKTGSQVDGVCWRQDYSADSWHGWRTQLVRGASPPWPDLW